MIGVQRRYCAGRLFQSIVDTADHEVFYDFLRQVFLTGKKESCTVAVHRNGAAGGLLRIEAILPEPPGDPPVCRAVIFDVTDQITTERKLTETSRYLAALIDTSAGPIVVWDTRHRITIFNNGFERLTGRTASSVIGQPLEILFPPGEREISMAKIRVADGGMNENMEIPVIADKAVKQVLWNATALYGQDGTWTATVAQGQDISGLKATEQELRGKIGELDAANAALTALGRDLRSNEQRLTESLAEKEILLAEIHHRVKNNLASFISLLSLEGAYDDTPKGRQLRNDLQNRARTMALIHETLYRSGKFSEVDMDQYFSQLAAQVSSSFSSAVNVQTTIDAKGVSLDLARATPAGLIVSELLTNAFKYAWPEGFVCEAERGGPCAIGISLRREASGHVLEVRDNGIGLPPAIDPEKTRTLGLKLVTFLARHQLGADTEVLRERGTRFIFRLRKKDGT
jgi:PAS domain S-box-containing protein